MGLAAGEGLGGDLLQGRFTIGRGGQERGERDGKAEQDRD
jgi:hypothetical protein